MKINENASLEFDAWNWDYLWREGCAAMALVVHIAHEHNLDPVLIGAGAAHHWEHLVQAGGCHCQH